MVDLHEHASHRVQISNLVTHSKHKYKIATINAKVLMSPVYVVPCTWPEDLT